MSCTVKNELREQQLREQQESRTVKDELRDQLQQFLEKHRIITGFTMNEKTWHFETNKYVFNPAVITSVVLKIVDKWVKQGIKKMEGIEMPEEEVVEMVRKLVDDDLAVRLGY
ncbi:hypothetical protein L211DRAFT_847073 [Terfezia boudieri ATCC MYA-4762]|uniref:Uncharacterized protein n=1 Tax=Terfezia boudieri ATCC MYA-4762 TaxID=1051890 RepID=A0A3N4LU32_9PEZI|nr:hypothetical protein L211DRAFT_847073 [Terfezia boudieri ATCC MYA-4762]